MKYKLITFFDFETTGLLVPVGSNLNYQPHTIEICSRQLNKKGKVVAEIDTLIKPPVTIPTYITNHVNHISNEMVEGKPRFKDIAKAFKKTFQGSDIIVAQNLMFDKGMANVEFARLGKKIKFPSFHYCTVEQSMSFEGYRLTSAQLHSYATGCDTINNHHRAGADVDALIEYFDFINGGFLPDYFKRFK